MVGREVASAVSRWSPSGGTGRQNNELKLRNGEMWYEGFYERSRHSFIHSSIHLKKYLATTPICVYNKYDSGYTDREINCIGLYNKCLKNANLVLLVSRNTMIYMYVSFFLPNQVAVFVNSTFQTFSYCVYLFCTYS